ncbi:MAG: ketol-acid reductoisomerase [Phycisphaerae bacterium]|nr:ketol-acid reductoisomerase [Phycisphaerae bacterium]
MPQNPPPAPDIAPADLAALRDRTIAIVGYGNQGAAHAANLRDNGLQITIGARPGGAGWRRAETDGFAPRPIAEATAGCDLLVVALPDEVQPAVWASDIAPNLTPGVVVGFLHGFAIHHGLITAPPGVPVVMVAPKGPGHTLRQRFVGGAGLPCLFAVAADDPEERGRARGLAWAHGIGGGRAAIIETTFADETETDLFGEQAVLCGGMTALIVAAFETLVAAGYPADLAYMEVCQEVKQVADLVYERGLAGMMEAISNTAEFGAYRAGPVVVDDALRRRLETQLAGIRDGTFARIMMNDHAQGFPWFTTQRVALRDHPIEAAGKAVRSWMTRGSERTHR